MQARIAPQPKVYQDKIVFYASVFVYNPKLKEEFIDYAQDIQKFESKRVIDSIMDFIGSQIFPHGSN
jgi:hypothetical protein